MSEEKVEQAELELLKVEETPDGSAVVELPKNEEATQEEEKKAEKPQKSDDDDDDDEESVEAEASETGQDIEAIREARRNKRKARKEMRKQAEAEQKILLQQLKREVQELREQNAVLSQKTHGSEIARIDAAIQDQKNRIAFAKTKISEAFTEQNGDLATQAQEMLYEARRNLESLEAFKKQAVAPTPQRTIQAPDMAVQRNANKWMAKHDWYDPTGQDQDSRIALEIDRNLASEGFDPKTDKYWDELDNRLQRYLPHRYTDQADSSYVQPIKKPKAIVTGSGKENPASSGGKGNTFMLSPDQVRAMKDAGMWDDPEKRSKMIKRYAEISRQQRN